MDLRQSTSNHVLRLLEYDSAISHNVSLLHYHIGRLRWNTEGWEEEANTSLLALTPVYLQLSSPYEGSTLGNQFQIAVRTGKGMMELAFWSRNGESKFDWKDLLSVGNLILIDSWIPPIP